MESVRTRACPLLRIELLRSTRPDTYPPRALSRGAPDRPRPQGELRTGLALPCSAFPAPLCKACPDLTVMAKSGKVRHADIAGKVSPPGNHAGRSSCTWRRSRSETSEVGFAFFFGCDFGVCGGFGEGVVGDDCRVAGGVMGLPGPAAGA